MGESIFAKIKAKLKKSSDEEEDELTDELELEEEDDEDEEYEEEDEEYEDEEDEEDKDTSSATHPLVAKVKQQLPFLAKAISSIPLKKKQVSSDIDEEQDIDLAKDVKADAMKVRLKKLKGEIAGKLQIFARILKKGKQAEGNSYTDEQIGTDGLEFDEKSGQWKAKKKIKVIHVVIGLILLLAFALEFMPTEEEPVVTNFKPPVRPKKNIETPKEEIKSEEKKVEPSEPVVADTTEQVEDAKDTNLQNTPEQDQLKEIFPDENLNEPNNQKTTAENKDEEQMDSSTDTAGVTNDPEVDYSGGEDYMELSGPEAEETLVNSSEDKEEGSNSTEELVGNNIETPKNENKVVDLTGDLDFGDKLSNKILKDLEGQMKKNKMDREKGQVALPTDPPDYENLGRGLVYNCNGLHWACIDKISYDECYKNNQWNKQQKKSSECIPVQVYSDIEDCQVVQQHKINSVAETKFCRKL